MLTTIHLIVGLVVVVSNGAAAALLWGAARRGEPVGGRAGQALAVAWGSLALQIVLGVVLAAGGAVGVAAHYLAAMAAGGVAWAGFSRRSGATAARDAAAACAATALLALAALLLGWR